MLNRIEEEKKKDLEAQMDEIRQRKESEREPKQGRSEMDPLTKDHLRDRVAQIEIDQIDGL